MELYKKHRPTEFKQMVGQDAAVKALAKMVKEDSVPHAVMFTGPSGTGKTTAARILVNGLGCHEMDLTEMNCADIRGIDAVRDIRGKVGLHPIDRSRAWIIDEAHKLTNDAQNAMLKMLEDTPPTAYFILATTEPNKLIKTVRTRCTEIAMRPITPKHMHALLIDVTQKATNDREGDRRITDEVYDKIVDAADGSARKALVLLEQVMQLKDEDEQLGVIQNAYAERSAYEICRALMGRPKWAEVGRLLAKVEEDPESVRRAVLGYFAKVLMGGGKFAVRAAQVIDCCQDNVFDSGKAGLALQLYRACTES